MSATNTGWSRLVDMPDAEVLTRFEAELAAHPDAPADPETLAMTDVTDQQTAAAHAQLDAEAPVEPDAPVELSQQDADAMLAALADDPDPAVREFAIGTMTLPPYDPRAHRPLDWDEIRRHEYRPPVDVRALVALRAQVLIVAYTTLAARALAHRHRARRHVARMAAGRRSSGGGDDAGGGGDGSSDADVATPLRAVAA
jgi:hypothetical protein